MSFTNTSFANTTFDFCGFQAGKNRHPHEAIIFLFVALAAGGLTMHILSHKMPGIPYTIVLLLEGFLLGWWNRGQEEATKNCNFDFCKTEGVSRDDCDVTNKRCVGWLDLGMLGDSMEMWSCIDPHLLLFAFLPALLFADSMGLNWHMWKRCLTQCLLLATVGVVISAILTAGVAVYILPYHWTYPEAMMFGSILAATDPVAVVSILKELGAPPSLTMCISGESLLNDGTAIVMFNLFQALALHTKDSFEDIGTTMDGWDSQFQVTRVMFVVKYFVRMVGGGVLLGLFLGSLGVIWLQKCKRKTSHIDNIVQLTITVCLAYVTFFLCEGVFGFSGVLGTVSAALVISSRGWPHFVSPETMGSVWHFIEFCGNTLIFLLAGVILGGRIIWRAELNIEDIGWLLVLYLSLILVRLTMVIVLFPFLKGMGYGFSWKEVIVVTWGGLRGALGLALALEVDRSFATAQTGFRTGSKEEQEKDRHYIRLTSLVLFHCGGIAVLTLLFNGGSTGKLLSILDFQSSRTSSCKEAILAGVDVSIQKTCKRVLDEEVARIDREGELDLTVASGQELRKRVYEKVEALRARNNRGHSKTADQKIADPLLAAATTRELFLQMLGSKYLELVDDGVLLAHGSVTVILSDSVSEAMDYVNDSLCDWDRLQAHIYPEGPVKKLIDRIPRLAWGDSSGSFRGPLEIFMKAMGFVLPGGHSVCYVLSCFRRAHGQTQDSIREIMPESPELSLVLSESAAQVKLCQEAIDQMDQDFMKEVEAEQLVNVVLEGQRRFIEKLVHQGALQETQAHHLLEGIGQNLNEIDHVRHKINQKARKTLINLGNMGNERTIELAEIVTPSASAAPDAPAASDAPPAAPPFFSE